MNANNISAAVTPADKTTAITKLNDVKALLPFLLTLSPSERKKLRKMATKRLGYVKAVKDAVKAYPAAVPGDFDVAEYEKDGNLLFDLRDIYDIAIGISQGIDDTMLAVGNDLMQESDTAYGHLKQSAKKNPALKVIVDQIGTAFKGQGKKKKPNP